MQWKGFLQEQLTQRGIHMDFSQLFLHPLKGLVAREVKVYNEIKRERVLLTVDEILLDVDYTDLFYGHVGVEGLSLQHASLELPLVPEDPLSEALRLQKFSAQAMLQENQLIIQKAVGELAGVKVQLSGALDLSQATSEKLRGKGKPSTQEERALAADKRITFLRENRRALQDWLKWSERFQMPQPPELRIVVNGDLENVEDLDVKLQVKADSVKYEGYQCQALELEARYHAGYVELRKLVLKDNLGEFTANASCKSGSGKIQFHLDSSADLPSLARAFLDSDALHEIVFYDPPQLSVNGVWFIKGSRMAQSKPPLEAIAQIQCAKFATRGEIFEGASGQLFLSPEGHYARDVIIRHKSGSAAAQWMSRPEGFRYEAVVKMDPATLVPFVGKETKEILNRFELQPDSTVIIKLAGDGPTPLWKDCVHEGSIQLSDFLYRDIPFKEGKTEVQFIGHTQRFKNITLIREEGFAAADEVYVDGEAATVDITHGQVTCDPVALTQCFAPPTAQVIARYEFSPSTQVGMAGKIGWKTSDATDFAVSFHTREGGAKYTFFGRDIFIQGANGDLVFTQKYLNYDIKGSVFGGSVAAQGSVKLGAENANTFTANVSADSFPHPAFGKELPLQKLTAQIRSQSPQASYDIRATLFGGSFKLAGNYRPGEGSTPYEGELHVDAISFSQFASVYSPENATEGDVTGHFKFTGKFNDWSALQGDGVAVILNGNLYAVPILGPLTPLLNGLLPRPIAGYNVAKEANCTFRVAAGKVLTEDFEALTTTFRIVAKGAVDFISDGALDFEAQARVRGLPGIVLRPVSELLEYKAEGTIGTPQWRTAYFSRSSKKGP
jgi:hypothetical protein